MRASDVGPDGLAHPAAFYDLLQESASLHAHALGAAPAQLLGSGATWFLSRVHLRIARMPRWREEVEVVTWPSGLEGPYARRDFRAMVDGEEVATAASWWLLIDLERRKPLRRLPADLRAWHPADPVLALDVRPPRLQALDQDTQAEPETCFQIRRHDIDINAHVNSAVYVASVMETTPVSLVGEMALRELELEIRAECGAQDQLIGKTQRSSDGTFLHRLVRSADGREAARARTHWSLVSPPPEAAR